MMITTSLIIFDHVTQEGMELNKYYHIEFYEQEVLIKVDNISFCGGVKVSLLARLRKGAFQYRMECNDLRFLHYQNKIHEVKDIKDLPLYLGWFYTSPEFIQMIKQGTWEISPPEAVCK
jgi:hypothetical protein